MARRKVWVLYTETDFEGQQFLGVYASSEGAQAAADEDHRSPLTWHRDSDGDLTAPNGWWSSSSYEVREVEVGS